MALILRLFSYLYHGLLSLGLLALGLVAFMSDTNNLRLEMLPWSGRELNCWLAGMGVTGLLSVLLAVTGKLRLLFPLWAFFALIMMVRGYLLQPYTFDGEEHFYRVLAFIGGAVISFLASLTLFRAKRRQ